MQRMLHNPYVGILKEQVDFWVGKLDVAQQILGEAKDFFRQLLSLQTGASVI